MRGEIITHEEMLAIPAIEISEQDQLPPEPLVSVIVLTYNHEAYIKEAIEGILAQQVDFPIEVIIGEDKSIDRTLEICLDYQKRFPQLIRIVTWHENIGANENSLRVWARARGKYIAICEGDDYWIDPAKLTKQVSLMEQSPGTILCGARVRILDNSNPDLNGKVFGPEEIKSRYRLEDVINNYLFHTSTYFYRSTDLKVQRQANTIAYLDYFLQHLCAIQGDLVCLPDVVSVYRHHAGGISFGSSRLLHCENIIAVYQTLIPLVDEYYGRSLKRRIDVIRSFLCHKLVDSGRLGDARLIAREIIWELARHDPLRAVMMLGHVLAPGLYQKARKFRVKTSSSIGIGGIGKNAE